MTPPTTIVLYPSPGMGHLVSMFELAKLLTNHHHLAVTILIVEPHYNTGSTAPFIARASVSNPSISFHRLPSVTPPPNPSPHHEANAFDLLRLSNPNLLDFLSSSSPPPSALIVDFFCIIAFDVTSQLEIPTYLFFTSGANCLAAFLHFPEIHSKTSASFRELGPTKLDIPGVPSLPADHMPLPMLDRDDNAYVGFLNTTKRFVEVKGIIINTISAIETRAIDAIRSAGKFPPLYCIGPLVKSEEKNSEAECLRWLDGQPKGSVVFLCFGSLGLFSAEQLKEIAVGLERSGQRFLWVVRSPPSADPRFKPHSEPDLDALLPHEFLTRTQDRGMVVKSWAPQAEVLKHEAVGGFVTHCGWNSVLEAICAGVPMIAWPLYAEQKMNLVFLVEEFKLAVEMKGYHEGFVEAEEVEKKVRWLMESEDGKELRDRTVKAKEAAAAALESGGASHLALMEIVKELKDLMAAPESNAPTSSRYSNLKKSFHLGIRSILTASAVAKDDVQRKENCIECLFR